MVCESFGGGGGGGGGGVGCGVLFFVLWWDVKKREKTHDFSVVLDDKLNLVAGPELEMASNL